jgi:hypothetical protein
VEEAGYGPWLRWTEDGPNPEMIALYRAAIVRDRAIRDELDALGYRYGGVAGGELQRLQRDRNRPLYNRERTAATEVAFRAGLDRGRELEAELEALHLRDIEEALRLSGELDQVREG